MRFVWEEVMNAVVSGSLLVSDKIGCATLRGEGDGAEGAPGAVDDFQGGGDDYGARGGQLIEVAKAGEAEFAAAVHYEMI